MVQKYKECTPICFLIYIYIFGWNIFWTILFNIKSFLYCRFEPVLGGFWMFTWFSVQFSTQFLLFEYSPDFQSSSQLNFHNKNWFAPLHMKTGVKIALKFSHERETVIKIDSNIYNIYTHGESNRFISGRTRLAFQSLCISWCCVLLVVLLSWGCYFSPVVIIFFIWWCFFSMMK